MLIWLVWLYVFCYLMYLSFKKKIPISFQTNAKFEAERDDVRQAMRGEFTVAIEPHWWEVWSSKSILRFEIEIGF